LSGSPGKFQEDLDAGTAGFGRAKKVVKIENRDPMELK